MPDWFVRRISRVLGRSETCPSSVVVTPQEPTLAAFGCVSHGVWGQRVGVCVGVCKEEARNEDGVRGGDGDVS